MAEATATNPGFFMQAIEVSEGGGSQTWRTHDPETSGNRQVVKFNYGRGYLRIFLFKWKAGMLGGVSLNYQCVYLPSGPNPQAALSGVFVDGQECPANNITLIRSIRLWLDGPNAGQYRLSYSGRVVFDGAHNPPRDYAERDGGTWLGEPLGGGAPKEWLAKGEFFISPR